VAGEVSYLLVSIPTSSQRERKHLSEYADVGNDLSGFTELAIPWIDKASGDRNPRRLEQSSAHAPYRACSGAGFSFV
jgi:hypothetical protein